jgi:hypothetical protein
MTIDVKLEQRWLRAQPVFVRSSGSPLASACRNLASRSASALASSKDYRAARVVRRVRAVLSSAC